MKASAYKNLNTLNFGARAYDPSIGRWLTQDPMAEKYYAMTPYNYCAGNPVKYVDLFGLYTSTLNIAWSIAGSKIVEKLYN